MKKTRLLFWLKTFLLLYILAGVGLYFFQDKFLFHPTPLPASYQFNFSQPFQERKIEYDKATTFDIVRFKPDDSLKRKGAVIYFHGNMSNIIYYGPAAENFTKHGYEVWMMDYPEFGKSTGNLSENMLYTEALEVYKMVRATGFEPADILLYGRSLGTGIAAQLASVRDCRQLILESPYYSLPFAASHFCPVYPVNFMLNFKIPTYAYLKKVTAPVIIFHGTEDNTIPFANARKLKPFLKPGDKLIAIDGGHHNDLNGFPLMHKNLDSLLSL